MRCQGEKGGATLNYEGDSDGKNSAIERVFKGSLFFTTAGGLGHTEQKAKGLRGTLGQQSELSDAKIGSGLKEALKVGTENTVNLTGKTDGYFLNQAIKILMPEKLQTLEKGLRMVGYGSQVDEFVLGMNRAAEQAAPYAKQIFWDAIGEMTFEDARKILSGNDTAATQYFKGKTTGKLTAAFQPVVEKSMNKVGVTKQYNELGWTLSGGPVRQKRDV